MIGSYVNYDQSLYRTGFRPYGLTNPQAATMLQGIGQSHSFGPWELHGVGERRGMGQSHPFTRRGGWPLHGLGDLNADVTAMANEGYTAAQIQQVVSAHTGGSLSDAGYNAIVSGFVSPSQLAAFLDQDPGQAPAASAGGPGGNWGTWIQQNAGMITLAVVAVVAFSGRR